MQQNLPILPNVRANSQRFLRQPLRLAFARHLPLHRGGLGDYTKLTFLTLLDTPTRAFFFGPNGATGTPGEAEHSLTSPPAADITAGKPPARDRAFRMQKNKRSTYRNVSTPPGPSGATRTPGEAEHSLVSPPAADITAGKPPARDRAFRMQKNKRSTYRNVSTPSGPSGATRTPGLLNPNQARYHLRYTRMVTGTHYSR